jgi:energy-coupling factor transporter ATP-binding protein EcfA2
MNFKFPIEYQTKTKQLSNFITNDLELSYTVDPSNNTINQQIFQPITDVGLEINKEMLKIYSYDSSFLKDTQKMLKKYKNKELINLNEINNIITENDKLSNFKEKYFYIEWECLEMLNRNENFLTIMSFYNLSSPILSLIFPVLLLFIPFFILQVQQKPIEIKEYLVILKSVLSNHAIGKVLFHWNNAKGGEKVYILLSLAFYIFSIYQNIRYCIRFYNNIKTIHYELFLLKDYISNTLLNIEHYLDITKKLKTYKKFSTQLADIRNKLQIFHNKIDFSPFHLSYKKVLEIGNLLKVYYEFNQSPEMKDTLLYSLKFNGYLDNINGLKKHVVSKKMNFSSFGNKTNFKNIYYPSLINNKPIVNDLSIEKNIILTGPNASGKTTILKSCLINIILSQAYGCGCYTDSTVQLYKHLHCYLNIPDTLGRDSLFQAEARRCKEIIDAIAKYPTDTHFCAFDELYSGTNPKEAISSATSFMEYIIKNKNVDCLLTTHFIDVCTQLDKHERIQNYLMNVEILDDKIKFTYKVEEGISQVSGGIDILKKLNYPQEIIDSSIDKLS